MKQMIQTLPKYTVKQLLNMYKCSDNKRLFDSSSHIKKKQRKFRETDKLPFHSHHKMHIIQQSQAQQQSQDKQNGYRVGNECNHFEVRSPFYPIQQKKFTKINKKEHFIKSDYLKELNTSQNFSDNILKYRQSQYLRKGALKHHLIFNEQNSKYKRSFYQSTQKINLRKVKKQRNSCMLQSQKCTSMHKSNILNKKKCMPTCGLFKIKCCNCNDTQNGNKLDNYNNVFQEILRRRANNKRSLDIKQLEFEDIVKSKITSKLVEKYLESFKQQDNCQIQHLKKYQNQILSRYKSQGCPTREVNKNGINYSIKAIQKNVQSIVQRASKNFILQVHSYINQLQKGGGNMNKESKQLFVDWSERINQDFKKQITILRQNRLKEKNSVEKTQNKLNRHRNGAINTIKEIQNLQQLATELQLQRDIMLGLERVNNKRREEESSLYQTFVNNAHKLNQNINQIQKTRNKKTHKTKKNNKNSKVNKNDNENQNSHIQGWNRNNESFNRQDQISSQYIGQTNKKSQKTNNDSNKKKQKVKYIDKVSKIDKKSKNQQQNQITSIKCMHAIADGNKNQNQELQQSIDHQQYNGKINARLSLVQNNSNIRSSNMNTNLSRVKNKQMSCFADTENGHKETDKVILKKTLKSFKTNKFMIFQDEQKQKNSPKSLIQTLKNLSTPTAHNQQTIKQVEKPSQRRYGIICEKIQIDEFKKQQQQELKNCRQQIKNNRKLQNNLERCLAKLGYSDFILTNKESLINHKRKVHMMEEFIQRRNNNELDQKEKQKRKEMDDILRMYIQLYKKNRCIKLNKNQEEQIPSNQQIEDHGNDSENTLKTNHRQQQSNQKIKNQLVKIARQYIKNSKKTKKEEKSNQNVEKSPSQNLQAQLSIYQFLKANQKYLLSQDNKLYMFKLQQDSSDSWDQFDNQQRLQQSSTNLKDFMHKNKFSGGLRKFCKDFVLETVFVSRVGQNKQKTNQQDQKEASYTKILGNDELNLLKQKSL